MGAQPAATTPGLGADWMSEVGGRHAAIGLVLGSAAAALAAGWWAGLVVGVGAAAASIVVALARRTLGGVSGDVLGAIEQVVEATTLIILVAVAG